MKTSGMGRLPTAGIAQLAMAGLAHRSDLLEGDTVCLNRLERSSGSSVIERLDPEIDSTAPRPSSRSIACVVLGRGFGRLRATWLPAWRGSPVSATARIRH